MPHDFPNSDEQVPSNQLAIKHSPVHDPCDQALGDWDTELWVSHQYFSFSSASQRSGDGNH